MMVDMRLRSEVKGKVRTDLRPLRRPSTSPPMSNVSCSSAHSVLLPTLVSSPDRSTPRRQGARSLAASPSGVSRGRGAQRSGHGVRSSGFRVLLQPEGCTRTASALRPCQLTCACELCCPALCQLARGQRVWVGDVSAAACPGPCGGSRRTHCAAPTTRAMECSSWQIPDHLDLSETYPKAAHVCHHSTCMSAGCKRCCCSADCPGALSSLLSTWLERQGHGRASPTLLVPAQVCRAVVGCIVLQRIPHARLHPQRAVLHARTQSAAPLGHLLSWLRWGDQRLVSAACALTVRQICTHGTLLQSQQLLRLSPGGEHSWESCPGLRSRDLTLSGPDPECRSLRQPEDHLCGRCSLHPEP